MKSFTLFIFCMLFLIPLSSFAINAGDSSAVIQTNVYDSIINPRINTIYVTYYYRTMDGQNRLPDQVVQCDAEHPALILPKSGYMTIVTRAKIFSSYLNLENGMNENNMYFITAKLTHASFFIEHDKHYNRLICVVKG